MKIAIAGYGYVGRAMYEMVKNHYTTDIFDPPLGYDADVDLHDLAIICLPTPSNADGSCDASLVEDYIKEMRSKIFLIKSTVPVGFTDRLKKETGKRIVFSPEYAGESKYWTPYKFHTDMKETPWMTLGGDPKDTEELVEIFTKILGPTKHYYQCTAKEAEMAKYVENTFYALKVTFCNEIYEICERLGVDYYKMRELWLADPRVNPMHTLVFKDDRGYGGKCFPKDTKALIRLSQEAGYEPELLKEMVRTNNKFRHA